MVRAWLGRLGMGLGHIISLSIYATEMPHFTLHCIFIDEHDPCLFLWNMLFFIHNFPFLCWLGQWLGQQLESG